jgi:ABC-type molybdenum transport system ATPase subunit/photorepair protein PhrA
MGSRESIKSLTILGLLEELRSQFEKARSLNIHSSGSPLSRTEQRLLLFARAMVNLPALIIVDGMLDELDEESLERVLTRLTEPAKHSGRWLFLLNPNHWRRDVIAPSMLS